jgi:hypothetical protein
LPFLTDPDRLSILVPHELVVELTAVARRRGNSLSGEIRHAMRAAVAEAASEEGAADKRWRDEHQAA